MNYQTIIILLIALVYLAYVACEKNQKQAVEQQTAPAAKMSYHITFEQWDGDMPTTIYNGVDTTLYDPVEAYKLLANYQSEISLWADRETHVTFQVYEHPKYGASEAGPDSIERLSLEFPEYAR